MSQAKLKKSILTIDDNPELLEVQSLVLEQDGFKVFTAQSGAEAFALLDQIEKPHLILLDMQIGDMSGEDFLLQLEKTHPEIMQKVPVVFLTGREDVPCTKAVGLIRKVPCLKEFLKSVHQFVEPGAPG